MQNGSPVNTSDSTFQTMRKTRRGKGLGGQVAPVVALHAFQVIERLHIGLGGHLKPDESVIQGYLLCGIPKRLF